jgi:hypothetical protein
VRLKRIIWRLVRLMPARSYLNLRGRLVTMRFFPRFCKPFLLKWVMGNVSIFLYKIVSSGLAKAQKHMSYDSTTALAFVKSRRTWPARA